MAEAPPPENPLGLWRVRAELAAVERAARLRAEVEEAQGGRLLLPRGGRLRYQDGACLAAAVVEWLEEKSRAEPGALFLAT